VQKVVVDLLNAIYEQDFLGCEGHTRRDDMIEKRVTLKTAVSFSQLPVLPSTFPRRKY
jgi:hypothetical protein